MHVTQDEPQHKDDDDGEEDGPLYNNTRLSQSSELLDKKDSGTLMSSRPSGISYPSPPEGDVVSVVVESGCDAPIVLSRGEKC